MLSLKGKFFGDSLLIVFSVLFALFINYKTKQAKEVALEGIRSELERNRSIVTEWTGRHGTVRNRISSLVRRQNDSLRQEMLKYPFLNFGVLTDNQVLVDDLLTNTAWESTKTTGLIAEFDFETIQKLTSIYSMQDLTVNRTILGIVDFYYDRGNQNVKELDAIMLQLMLRFYDLTSKEETLLILYEEGLEVIGE